MPKLRNTRETMLGAKVMQLIRSAPSSEVLRAASLIAEAREILEAVASDRVLRTLDEEPRVLLGIARMTADELEQSLRFAAEAMES